MLAGSDLIVCVGLFDYLPAAAAKSMLQAFWRLSAPDAKIMVFNFSHNNPSRSYMEWLGNWYLIYRTADELRNIAAAAGIPVESTEVLTEKQGINLYLTANKT